MQKGFTLIELLIVVQ
ncbi:prepilin-type N-terminal cleavage/methylation domain-containing protein [Acinetobacter haemolyticus]